MKRFIAVLVVAMLLVSMIGIMTASAASAKVSFSGPKEVQAGKTYTISYTLKVSGAAAANANISVGGVFETVSGGDNLFHDTVPNNTSKSYKGSVKVKVASGAQPGDKGTISVSGGYSFVDEAYNESSGGVSGGYSATVVTQLSSTPKPETEGGEPKATREPSEWEKLADSVGQMPEGDKLMVDITGSTKIPASLLSALKEKQGILELNFGSYSCLINGASLNIAEDLKELDLSLSMEKDEALSAVSGGQDVYQLHFAHSGQLPGPITYRIKAEGSNPGDTLYLYYYYGQAGVLEGKQIAVVDEEGYVNFTIVHCSSYVVTGGLIEGAMGALNAENPEKDQLIASLEARVIELETELAAAKEAAADVETPVVAEAPAQPVQTGLPIEVLVAVSLGAVLIAVFITMLACKAGPFKRGRHA